MRAECVTCRGLGWVRLARPGPETQGVWRWVDACGPCAAAAEVEWLAWINGKESGMFVEHESVDAEAASAVTMAIEGGRVRLRVGRPALESLPWYRGGIDVAVLLGGGRDAGRLRIQRGHGHRLRTVMQQGMGRLERLPPVQLVMDPFPGMGDLSCRAPCPVPYAVSPGLLEVQLPAWAAPPVPATAPPTSYAALGWFTPPETHRAGGAS